MNDTRYSTVNQPQWAPKAVVNDAKIEKALALDWYDNKIGPRLVITEDGCWEWQGAKIESGYGLVGLPSRVTFGTTGTRTVLVHRVAYIHHHKRSITEGMVIDHICRNRACANPDHLRELTNRENQLAPGSTSASARNAKRTVCERCLQPLSPDPYRAGWRRCLPCLKTNAITYRQTKKAVTA